MEKTKRRRRKRQIKRMTLGLLAGLGLALLLSVFLLKNDCADRRYGSGAADGTGRPGFADGPKRAHRESGPADENSDGDGCGESGQEEDENHREELSDEEKAEELLSGMTLKEKICQMLIVTPEQLTGAGKAVAAGETTRESLREFPVGGILYFAANLQNPKQIKAMIEGTQAFALEIEKMPLFICIDEEGGRVSRISGNLAFEAEKIAPMSEIRSEDEAYRVGKTIGSCLFSYGFNVDFAPDCDVLTNPDNTVIGDRSFGPDADIVKKYAKAFSDGLHEAGVLSTYKHFPGHGATDGDTHDGFAYTDKDLDELMQAELVPFGDAEAAQADMVMVSHISVPSILGDNRPCSLSYEMVTDVLQKKLGFEGLVVTDAMNMGAVTDAYTAGDAVVLAILAGNDLVLTPADFKEAVAAVTRAVECGELPRERIDASVKKIILKKLKIHFVSRRTGRKQSIHGLRPAFMRRSVCIS